MKKITRTLVIAQASITMLSLVLLSMPMPAFASAVVSICHMPQQGDEEEDTTPHVITVSSNAVEAHIAHGDTLDIEHCGTVTPPPPPITGTILITKYACPDGTSVVRSANGVGGTIPQGCVPQSGKTFGYVHGTQTDANSPYPELTAPLTAGGTTNSSGVLSITNLPSAGRYLIEETNSTNQRLPDSEVLGLYCSGDGDTSSSNDNQELTFVPAGGTVSCVAYDKAPAQPASCKLVSDTTTMVGTASAALSFVHLAWTHGLDISGAKWIWNAFHATPGTADEVVTFTKKFNVVGTPSSVKLDLAADNTYSVKVNGLASCSDTVNLDNFSNVEPTCDITALVTTGVNTLTFTVTNKGGFGTDPESNPGGLIYKVTVDGASCAEVPPPATMIKVHLYKYLKTGETTSQIPDSAVGVPQFPMFATYSATNIGSGTNAPYVLGNNHGGAAFKWAADTSSMSVPANYESHENTDGTVVVPNADSCSPGKYFLVGYKNGDTLVAAQTASVTATAPSYTGLTSDKYEIVVNQKCADAPAQTHTEQTIVVKSTDLETQALPAAYITPSGKWFFYNDTTDAINNALGSFVTGPATAPAGTGSAEMTLAAALSRTNIATFAFSNTKLSDITSLMFSSYSHSGIAGASESPYLVFNVSFNGTGAYQRRLVYVPSANGTVPQDAWNTNDAINGGAAKWTWSGYAASGNKWPDGNTSEYRTWSSINSAFPSARVLPVGGLMGVRVGEPGPAGYTGNVDKFVIGIKTGVNTDTRTYDFEPIPQKKETIVVSGNTAPGVNQSGWLFNRDTTTATPFAFNTTAPDIGTGSLQVFPITNTYNGSSGACKGGLDQTGCNKFVGELFLLKAISAISSISYDFKISAPNVAAANQFYLNVYANFGESSPTKFYDCRYDVVPTIGSVAGFTTVTFDPNQNYPVTTRAGATPSPHTCPSSPSGMDALGAGPSTIRAIVLNVGDTTASDQGVGGFFDKVVVNSPTLMTTYDFEPVPTKPVDMCSNIEGNQATVPAGMTANDGVCTTTPIVTTQTTDTSTTARSGSSRRGGGTSGGGQVLGASTTGGQVLGASTAGQVLGESCGLYLEKNLRLGSRKNDAEQARKLQTFLNKHQNAGLAVTGFFGKLTESALKVFQKQYSDEVLTPWGINSPTGIAYYTTLKKVNEIECPELVIQLPPLVDWSSNPKPQ